jgi:hypothetical protein
MSNYKWMERLPKVIILEYQQDNPTVQQMSSSNYNDKIVNQLRKRLWVEAYKYANEQHAHGGAVSGLELLMALHQMIEETHHHWIADEKKWNDILASSH